MKKTINYFLVSFFCIFFGTNTFAQSETENIQFYNYSHADHHILMQKVKENPEVIQDYIIYENEMKQIIENMKSGNIEKSLTTDTVQNGKKIIPVVFHIIHAYGEENISDSQILDAIEKLNLDYAKGNADTIAGENTYGPFNARRADVGLEFRLAKIDPDGNCTNGIDRIYDERTNFAYYTLCSEYAWDPSKYLNIYSVAFIYPEGMSLPDGAAIGGMSVFPPSNPLTPLFTGGDTDADGVLIRHDGIGSIGTAVSLMGQPINALNRVFTHELGHYFNLYHPFQNLKLTLGILPSMAEDGCATSGGFLGLTTFEGDEVDDTPPVKDATQNTSLNCFPVGVTNSCDNDVPGYGDEPDMVENYMDYQFGYCQNIFTLGQNERIQATLMTDRRDLWSYENLVATGVWDTEYNPLCAPIADFTISSGTICAGEGIGFMDVSHGGAVENRTWTFEGGNPASSDEANPTVTYNTPGTYKAKLVVSNANGTDEIEKESIIKVMSDEAVLSGDIFIDFTGNMQDWTTVNQDGNTWEVTSSASYVGGKSLMIKNFEGNPNGSYDEYISPIMDLSHIDGLIKFNFRLAYTPKTVESNALAEIISGNNTADTVYDRLQVFLSTDCGQTWVSKYNKAGAGLMTNDTYITTEYTPTSLGEWRQETFLLSGVSDKSNVRLKFRFTGRGGNNVYIDRICAGDCDETGINDEIINNLNISINPNPITDNSQINFNLIESSQIQVSVFDALGKMVSNWQTQRYEAGQHSINIDKSQFRASGIYLIKMSVNDSIVTKRVVVQ